MKLKQDEAKLIFHLFYSKRFSRSKPYIDKIHKWLMIQGIPEKSLKKFEVENELVRWKTLGLMSSPAIVILAGSPAVPISNLVSYATTEKLKEVIKNIDLSTSKIKQKTKNENKHSNFNFLPYFVEGSSGVHRYLRWHEDYLMLDSDQNGWAGVSRFGFKDYIVCQLYSESLINKIVIIPRRRTDGTESYKSFPKSLSLFLQDGNKKNKIWSKKDINLRPNSEYYFINLKIPIKGKRFKFVIDDKHDINGKSFPSIMQIGFIGRAISKNSVFAIKPGKLREVYSKEILLKHGIYADNNLQVEQFNLVRDQIIPSNFSLSKRIVYLVSGKTSITINNEERDLNKNDVVIIDNAMTISFKGLSNKNSLLIMHTDPKAWNLWEAR